MRAAKHFTVFAKHLFKPNYRPSQVFWTSLLARKTKIKMKGSFRAARPIFSGMQYMIKTLMAINKTTKREYLIV